MAIPKMFQVFKFHKNEASTNPALRQELDIKVARIRQRKGPHILQRKLDLKVYNFKPLKTPSAASKSEISPLENKTNKN